MRVLLWKELLEQWRSYRLLVVGAVLTVLGLSGPLSAYYLPQLLAQVPGMPAGLADLMPEPDLGMAVGEYLDNLLQIGVILAILVPMAAVVGERVGGTAEITLSKPVSRGAFLGAKFIAYGLTFSAGMALASIAGYYYVGVLFEWLPPLKFLAVNAGMLLYLAVFVAISILASTLARSQLAAAGMGFGAMIPLGLLGAWPVLGPYLPGAIPAWARLALTQAESAPAWAGFAGALGIILAALVGAWLRLRRQEL